MSASNTVGAKCNRRLDAESPLNRASHSGSGAMVIRSVAPGGRSAFLATRRCAASTARAGSKDSQRRPPPGKPCFSGPAQDDRTGHDAPMPRAIRRSGFLASEPRNRAAILRAAFPRRTTGRLRVLQAGRVWKNRPCNSCFQPSRSNAYTTSAEPPNVPIEAIVGRQDCRTGIRPLCALTYRLTWTKAEYSGSAVYHPACLGITERDSTRHG